MHQDLKFIVFVAVVVVVVVDFVFHFCERLSTLYIDKNGTQRNNLHRCTYITTDATPRLPSLSIKIVMTPSDS